MFLEQNCAFKENLMPIFFKLFLKIKRRNTDQFIYLYSFCRTIRSDILNWIEEKVENSLEHISTGRNFLNRTSVANTIRPTMNKHGTSGN